MLEGQSVSGEEALLLMAVAGEAAAVATVGEMDETGSEEKEVFRHRSLQFLRTTYLGHD